MNKYEEALDYLRWIGSDGYYKKQREKSFDVLQELVDLSTPMKPKSFNDLRECCLCSCGYGFYDWGYNEYKYCPSCGQRLDWSEDE